MLSVTLGETAASQPSSRWRYSGPILAASEPEGYADKLTKICGKKGAGGIMPERCDHLLRRPAINGGGCREFPEINVDDSRMGLAKPGVEDLTLNLWIEIISSKSQGFKLIRKRAPVRDFTVTKLVFRIVFNKRRRGPIKDQ
jgi:hypothetical protein